MVLDDQVEVGRRLQGTWLPPETKSCQITITLQFNNEFYMTIHALSTGEKVAQQLKGDKATGTWNIRKRRRPTSGPAALARESSGSSLRLFRPDLPHIAENDKDAPVEGPFLVLRINDLPKALLNIKIGVPLDIANWAVGVDELAGSRFFRIVDLDNYEKSIELEVGKGVVQTWRRVSRSAR